MRTMGAEGLHTAQEALTEFAEGGNANTTTYNRNI